MREDILNQTLNISVSDTVIVRDILRTIACSYPSYHYGPIIVSKRYDYQGVFTNWTPYAPGAPQNTHNYKNPIERTSFLGCFLLINQ
jgi:hypothetical protein